MVYKTFEELIAAVKCKPVTARMAVAAAGDEHTLQAVLRARAEGIVTPVLVGDKAIIDQVLAELGETVPAEDIYDELDLAEAARKAVALVKEGKADFLMKGRLDTSVLLKAVVNKENGLGKGGVMSHFTAFEVPTYHRHRGPPGRRHLGQPAPQRQGRGLHQRRGGSLLPRARRRPAHV